MAPLNGFSRVGAAKKHNSILLRMRSYGCKIRSNDFMLMAFKCRLMYTILVNFGGFSE